MWMLLLQELLWEAAQSLPDAPGGQPAFALDTVVESGQSKPNAKQTINFRKKATINQGQKERPSMNSG